MVWLRPTIAILQMSNKRVVHPEQMGRAGRAITGTEAADRHGGRSRGQGKGDDVALPRAGKGYRRLNRSGRDQMVDMPVPRGPAPQMPAKPRGNPARPPGAAGIEVTPLGQDRCTEALDGKPGRARQCDYDRIGTGCGGDQA